MHTLHSTKILTTLTLALSISLLSACTSVGNGSTNAGDNTAQTVRAKLPKTDSALVNATYPALPPATGMVRLVEGQSTFIKDKNLSLKFVNVLDDSRCPQHAQCIWAGSATVALEVMSTSSRPQTINLTTGALRGEQQRNTNMLGYNISLETLYPTPATDLDTAKMAGKYVIDIKIGAEKPIVSAPKI